MNDGLIKRSDAAEVVYKALKTPPPKGALTDTMSLAIALVQDIPSADRPQGEWIEWLAPNGIDCGAECSNCGKHIGSVPSYGTNYCPNCGADMRESN